MDVHPQTAVRWVLVLVTFCVTSLISLILLMGFMLGLDRFLVEAFLVFNIAPQATVKAAHQFELFLAILTWVLPSTCAVSFATRTSQRRALHFGLSISILLFATLCFFLGRSGQSIWNESVTVIAALAVLSMLVLSFFKLNLTRFLTFANLVAVLLLFSPSLVELLRKTNVAPQPK